MKVSLITIAILAAATSPVFAAGDVEAGKKVFNQCQTCHTVTDPSGAVLAGKGAKVGPNLYGVVGRPAASVEGFTYGDGIKAAAAKGLVWDEEKIAVYTQNPTKFLDEFTGDPKLKSKMAFKLAKPADGVNVAAFLASLAPPAAGATTTSP